MSLGNSDNYGALLDALGEVTEQRKALEAKEKELRAALGTYFEGRDGNFTHGNFLFSVKTNPGRKTLDKTSVSEYLSEQGVMIEQFEKVGKPYMTLSIKRLS